MSISHDEQFPLDPAIFYLNHAAVAPLPRCTADAIKQFTDENLYQGASHYPRWLEVEQSLRERCRALLNAASADDIALVKNTSEALSMVAHGLDWQAGQNVVTAWEEFPSNRMVWQSLSRYGVETRFVRISGQQDPEQALLDACDDNTRLLAISAVQYASGLRMDLERLGQACKAAGYLFCVDAIQMIGALPFDVQTIQADFVMADGHKWMLALEGLALFWTHEQARKQLKLYEYGWHMAENLYDFDAHDWQPAVSGRRFECGSPNMLGVHALHASIGLLLDTGLDTVSRNILNNTSYLIDYINNNDALELLSDARGSRRSGIVTFRHGTMENHALHQHLMANKVICAERGGGIRFSPHFYTTRQELDEVLGLLSSLPGLSAR
jgi:selenocysteine lyase/cysteine desulfurase